MMSIRDTLRAVSVDEHRRRTRGEHAHGNRHFGERRHAWAILDDENGRLIAADSVDDICDCGIETWLFTSRRRARFALGGIGFGRIVKVRVSYEVVS